jgi:DNA-binding NtrC family response regulator
VSHKRASVLLAWVGATDLQSAGVEEAPRKPRGPGPIAAALDALPFDAVVLLDAWRGDTAARYAAWLRERTKATVTVRRAPLPRPTDYEAIYRAACAAVDDVLARGDAALTFHLSPGTSAMSTVWVLLGKTRYDATLLQASPEEGVVPVAIPFELTAAFLPDLLRARDEALARHLRAAPDPGFAAIVHRAPAMKRVIERARVAALHPFPVLLGGETGTGKELFARALHEASSRRGKPLVVVNCGALPPQLVEATLFGWRRGAFTGATETRPGAFEEADGGTLFLDEVGELPLPAQTAMLRALQEGEVQRVGEVKPRKVDVRVVAATHRDLLADVSAGRFREDLFYRLAILALKIPALRDRGDDVALLAEHFLARLGQAHGRHKKLSPDARKLLLAHPWPGNVRELQATVQRAWVWSPGQRIDAADVADALLGGAAPSPEESARARPHEDGFDLRAALDAVARDHLTRAMKEAGGNKTRAAKILGLPSYQTLTNWLARYGVEG